MKVQDFLAVTECRGKSCIEDGHGDAPAGWPADGSVTMKDVVFHYATDAPSALSGVTMDIKSGEKIGVCGSESTNWTSQHFCHCSRLMQSQPVQCYLSAGNS